jgi:hypothetical protein
MNMEDIPIWMKRHIKRRMARNAEPKGNVSAPSSSSPAIQGYGSQSMLPSNIVLFPGAMRLRIQDIK